MKDRAARSKVFYDKFTKEPQISVGYKVLLFNDTLKVGESAKFHKNWTGPYLVVSKSDNGLLYTLRHCSTGREPGAAVHANRLKPYKDDRNTFLLRHNISPQHIDNPVPALPTAGDTMIPDNTRYPIERVLKHRKVGKKEYFLVKWLDSKGSQTWEPGLNVTQFAIDQYFVQKRNEAKRRRKC